MYIYVYIYIYICICVCIYSGVCSAMSSMKVLWGRPGSVKAAASIPQSPPRTLWTIKSSFMLRRFVYSSDPHQ